MSQSIDVRFGIDLGGTKIEIMALEVERNHDVIVSSKAVWQKRVSTPKHDYQATLNAIVNLIQEAEQKLQCNGTVGIGIPGAISVKTGKIKNANSTWLIGQDLQGDLQKRLNQPVALANDANCFTLSEATDGAAQNAEVVFGVIIGTGCGGGIVVHGNILSGINAISGEWGHNPLPWQTQEDKPMACYCGLEGCLETFLSGSGFQMHYQDVSGQELSAEEIVALAEQGDEQANQHLQNYIVWLAKGLASVINVIDPDVIVLGGGMSNIQQLYTEVPKIWQQWIFSDQVDTKLVPPKYGDSSGVRGAAWLRS